MVAHTVENKGTCYCIELLPGLHWWQHRKYIGTERSTLHQSIFEMVLSSSKMKLHASSTCNKVGAMLHVHVRIVHNMRLLSELRPSYLYVSLEILCGIPCAPVAVSLTSLWLLFTLREVDKVGLIWMNISHAYYKYQGRRNRSSRPVTAGSMFAVWYLKSQQMWSQRS